MDEQLVIRKLKRDIIDNEVSLILIRIAQEAMDGFLYTGALPDYDSHARKIIAYVREHSVR